MVERVSDLFSVSGKHRQTGQKKTVNPADVHAMDTAMKTPGTDPGLGSLFSSQVQGISKTGKGRTAQEPNLAGAMAERDPRLRETSGKRVKRRENERDDTPDDQDTGQGDSDHPNDLAYMVADQILSGGKIRGETIGDNEVIIRVKAEILEGCHIHLIKERDCLRVKLMASTRNTLQTLIGAQQDLVALLETHYNGLIRLSFHKID